MKTKKQTTKHVILFVLILITGALNYSNAQSPLVATCGGTNVSCAGGSDGTASVTITGGPSTVIGLGPVNTTAMPYQGIASVPAIANTCDCPPGYVAVGFEGISGQLVDQFNLKCKQLLPNGTLGATLVNTCSNGFANGENAVGPYLAATDEALVKFTVLESTVGCSGLCLLFGLNADSKSISQIYLGGSNATGLTNIGGFITDPANNPHPETAPDGNVIVGMINYQPNSIGWAQGVQFRYAPVTDVPATTSYLWSNGATTSSISNLSAGTYIVTVTKGGSSTTGSFTVNEPAPLVATCGGTNVSCAGGSDGTASVTITGGPSTVFGLGPVSTTAMPYQGVPSVPAIANTCDCPPGYVAVGFEGRSGQVIDRFNLKCLQLLPDGTLGNLLVNTCTNGFANGGAIVGPYLAAQDEALVKFTVLESSAGCSNFCYLFGLNADSKSISQIYSGSSNATGLTSIGGFISYPLHNPHPETAPDGNVIVGMINYQPNNIGWSQGVQFRYAPVIDVPASYLWSNNETTSSISNLTAGTYTVTVTKGNCSTTCSFTVTQPDAISVDAGPNKYVYRGYPDSSCTTLQSTISGGTAPLTRQWSTAGNANLGSGSTLNVCPIASRTYYLTVTDVAGCSQTDSVRVCVFDIRCGNGNNKVRVCHGTGSPNNPFVTLCVSVAEAKLHLQNHPGEKLGACGMNKTCSFTTLRLAANTDNSEYDMNLNAYPNPVSESLNISFYSEASTTYSLRIVNVTGQIILSEMKLASEGENNFQLDMSGFAPGMYTILMQSGDNMVQSRIMKE